MGLLREPRIGSDDAGRLAHHHRVRSMRQTAADLKATESARGSLPTGHPLYYTQEEREAFEREDERRRAEHEKSNPKQ